MNHDVFISYSSKNRSAATEVCNALEENGVRCWIAPRNITAGAQYGDLIEDAIKTCKVVVVLFSESAAASQWVSGELNVAFEENKVIIPLRLDQTPLKGQNRVMLNQRHWIDGSADYRAKFTDLVLAVSQATGKQDATDYEAIAHKQQTATAAPQASAPVQAKATTHQSAPLQAKATSHQTVPVHEKPATTPSSATALGQHKQFSGPIELKYGNSAKPVVGKRPIQITTGATPRPVSASGQPLRSARPVTSARTASTVQRTTGSTAHNQASIAAARQHHLQQQQGMVAEPKQNGTALWKIIVPIVAGVILLLVAILALVL